MEEYTLYLDESQNQTDNILIISGIIVKNCNIEKLKTGMFNVKKCIWDSAYIENNKPILHCVELETIKDYRNNKQKLPKIIKKFPIYSNLSAKTKDEIKNIYDRTYSKACEVLKNTECITIGCLVDLNNLSYIYGNSITENVNFHFDIAIQEIISNYAHFLSANNGVGNIIYESRNGQFDLTEKSNDFKMFNNFCKIKVCNKGISLVDETTIAKTIRYFYIYSKNEDIAGLQMADFVSYNFLQCQRRNDAQKTEFMKKISSRLYNGMYDISVKDLSDYFGLKKIPFDYQTLHNQRAEIGRLKRALENLKTEKNNLIKKNKLLTEAKSKLIHEKEALLEKLGSKNNIDNA